MRILNFGSLNIDRVYSMPHLILPEETVSSLNLEYFAGGKGLNQSVALARAGAQVYHAGKIGADGDMLVNLMEEAGVGAAHVMRDPDADTGHAVIQVDPQGQNCIILHGGANRTITKQFVDSVLNNFSEGEFLLLQNEISCLDYIVEKAYDKGMIIALNPAPMDNAVNGLDLSKINWLILNEVEGAGLSGKTHPDEICDVLLERLPATKLVLTLGGQGSCYADNSVRLKQGIFDFPAVDTTAAGDTFIGYFLTAIMENRPPDYALKIAGIASGIAVSRKGASSSIPSKAEVLNKLEISGDKK